MTIYCHTISPQEINDSKAQQLVVHMQQQRRLRKEKLTTENKTEIEKCLSIQKKDLSSTGRQYQRILQEEYTTNKLKVAEKTLKKISKCNRKKKIQHEHDLKEIGKLIKTLKEEPSFRKDSSLGKLTIKLQGDLNMFSGTKKKRDLSKNKHLYFKDH